MIKPALTLAEQCCFLLTNMECIFADCIVGKQVHCAALFKSISAKINKYM